MINNRINEYVYLLKLSKDFFVQSLDEYNSKKQKIELSEYHRLYYHRKYHVFAYSQLMYTLYERLKSESATNQKHNIEGLFRNSEKSTVRKVCSLFANMVKHSKQKNSVNISPIQRIKINFTTSKVDVGPEGLTLTSLEDSHIMHPDLLNVDLLSLVEESYNELLVFLKNEGYEC